MLEHVLFGFYIGVGTCLAVAFVFTEDPLYTEENTAIRAFQACFLAIVWPLILVGLVGEAIT